MLPQRAVYRIEPVCFANVWGGNKLRRYGKASEADRIGESWELSFVPGSEATVGGIPLSRAFTKEAWGTRASGFPFFPVLTKFIDAKEKLSVQVHPSDSYALENEGTYGKTEMWYVVEAEPGAGLYMGFRSTLTEDEVRCGIADGSIESKLSFVPVKTGDVFFIPAGTVHAIGGGVLIYEIQQNSTLTYRLYDYGRLGTDGKPRELHVEKALKVLKREPYEPITPKRSDTERVIGSCEYFTAREYVIEGNRDFEVTDASFLAINVTQGCGVLSFTDSEGRTVELSANAGDGFFVPACNDRFTFTLSGRLTVITTEI
jgi:mannose-6-phosphate isomerase